MVKIGVIGGGGLLGRSVEAHLFYTQLEAFSQLGITVVEAAHAVTSLSIAIAEVEASMLTLERGLFLDDYTDLDIIGIREAFWAWIHRMNPDTMHLGRLTNGQPGQSIRVHSEKERDYG